MTNHVLITGADRGLGFSLVKVFLENGYSVIAGKHNRKLNELVSLKEKYPATLETVELDVGDDVSVKNGFDRVAQFTDKLDIIINNAAVLGDIEKTIEDKLDFEEISNTMNINTLGPLRIVNAFYSFLMKSRSGLLVNISSEAGSIGQCGRDAWFGYCMSKSALNMQSALLHNYMKQKGGQVIAIHPGWMKTSIKGVRDEKADYEPDESADKIFGIIKNRKKFDMEKPVFIDINQKPQLW